MIVIGELSACCARLITACYAELHKTLLDGLTARRPGCESRPGRDLLRGYRTSSSSHRNAPEVPGPFGYRNHLQVDEEGRSKGIDSHLAYLVISLRKILLQLSTGGETGGKFNGPKGIRARGDLMPHALVCCCRGSATSYCGGLRASVTANSRAVGSPSRNAASTTSG